MVDSVILFVTEPILLYQIIKVACKLIQTDNLKRRETKDKPRKNIHSLKAGRAGTSPGKLLVLQWFSASQKQEVSIVVTILSGFMTS